LPQSMSASTTGLTSYLDWATLAIDSLGRDK
jgi:hypothetical protein